ncbi:MAG: carbohydrate ABC transporter permease, partial [Anaerolineae bacterium]
LPLAIIVFFRIFTVFGAVWISVVQYGPKSAPFVGAANYVATVKDDTFWHSMLVTLQYTLGVVPVGLVIALALSQAVFSLGHKSQVLYKAAYYLPAVVSGTVMSLVWLWLFDPVYGLLNYLFKLVGVAPLLWLRSPDTALPSLILMAVATGQGAAIVLLTAAMGGIPEPLYESARVDGATKWVEFRHITLPLLRPTILYLLIMGTIASFQVFPSIYVMTSGGPYHATETVVFLLYRYAFQLLDFSRASAIGVILAIILAGVSALQYVFVAGDSVEY